MIKEQHGKYLIYSKDGSKLLGTHSTKEKALKQERAIHMSKQNKSSTNTKTFRKLSWLKTSKLTEMEEAELFNLLNKLEVKQESMDYFPMGVGLGTSFGFVTAPELMKSKVKGGVVGATIGGGLGAILNKLTQPELSEALEKTSNIKLSKLINS